jgi:plastocyanin
MKIIRKCVLAALYLAAFMSAAWAGEQVTAVLERDGVQRLTMIVDSHFYKPDHVVVRAGVPVELTLISQTTLTPHNFVVKEPDAGIVINKEISAGETVTVRFTATKAGTYPFYCDKKLLFFKSHRDKGMEGILRVQ